MFRNIALPHAGHLDELGHRHGALEERPQQFKSRALSQDAKQSSDLVELSVR